MCSSNNAKHKALPASRHPIGYQHKNEFIQYDVYECCIALCSMNEYNDGVFVLLSYSICLSFLGTWMQSFEVPAFAGKHPVLANFSMIDVHQALESCLESNDLNVVSQGETDVGNGNECHKHVNCNLVWSDAKISTPLRHQMTDKAVNDTISQAV